MSCTTYPHCSSCCLLFQAASATCALTGRSNSPAFTPLMKAAHSSWSKVKVVLVGSLVSRTITESPVIFTDTQTIFKIRKMYLVNDGVRKPSSSSFWPTSLTAYRTPDGKIPRVTFMIFLLARCTHTVANCIRDELGDDVAYNSLLSYFVVIYKYYAKYYINTRRTIFSR